MVKITPESIRKYLKKRNPEWSERKIENAVKKQVEKVNTVLTTSPVKEGTITVEFSSGGNAKAECRYQTKDGKYHTIGSAWTAGYGYDKESAAVGALFREILLPNLIGKRSIPKTNYIIHYNDGYNLPIIHVEGAGISACASFVKSIGGVWKDVTYAPNFRVYSMKFR